MRNPAAKISLGRIARLISELTAPPCARAAAEGTSRCRGQQSTLPGKNDQPAWDWALFPLQSGASDDAFLAQCCELVRAHAEPSAENVVDVLTEQRRRFDLWWCTVE